MTRPARGSRFQVRTIPGCRVEVTCDGDSPCGHHGTGASVVVCPRVVAVFRALELFVTTLDPRDIERRTKRVHLKRECVEICYASTRDSSSGVLVISSHPDYSCGSSSTRCFGAPHDRAMARLPRACSTWRVQMAAYACSCAHMHMHAPTCRLQGPGHGSHDLAARVGRRGLAIRFCGRTALRRVGQGWGAAGGCQLRYPFRVRFRACVWLF